MKDQLHTGRAWENFLTDKSHPFKWGDDDTTRKKEGTGSEGAEEGQEKSHTTDQRNQVINNTWARSDPLLIQLQWIGGVW